MSENDLFGAADAPESMTRPLAVRMRPRTLDEVIGQTQVLGQGSPLRRLANPASKGSLTAPSSVILFGPPGVGKTTLATIVAGQSGRVFEELSAVTSGVKDVRDVLTRAHERLVSRGQGNRTVHRRGTSLLQIPAGCAASRRRKPRRDLYRRHHREPELFHHQTVALPFGGRQA